MSLQKARSHKYFKREGSPGSYVYYYTEAEYKQKKGHKDVPGGAAGKKEDKGKVKGTPKKGDAKKGKMASDKDAKKSGMSDAAVEKIKARFGEGAKVKTEKGKDGSTVAKVTDKAGKEHSFKIDDKGKAYPHKNNGEFPKAAGAAAPEKKKSSQPKSPYERAANLEEKISSLKSQMAKTEERDIKMRVEPKRLKISDVKAMKLNDMAKLTPIDIKSMNLSALDYVRETLAEAAVGKMSGKAGKLWDRLYPEAMKRDDYKKAQEEFEREQWAGNRNPQVKK